MLCRILLPCVLLLGLGACTSQTMADGSTRVSVSPANLFAQPGGPAQSGMASPASADGVVAFDQALVHRVAARFVADWRRGGMTVLVADINRCYADAERSGPDRYALKDCVALDTVGKNRDFDMQQRFHRPGLAFFSNDAGLARFNRYALQAFGSQGAALGFVGSDGRAAYFQGARMLGES